MVWYKMESKSHNKVICQQMKNMKQHKMIRKNLNKLRLNKKILQNKWYKILHHHHINWHMQIIFIPYHKLMTMTMMMKLLSRLMKVLSHLRMKVKKVFLINLSQNMTKVKARQKIIAVIKMTILKRKISKQQSLP